MKEECKYCSGWNDEKAECIGIGMYCPTREQMENEATQEEEKVPFIKFLYADANGIRRVYDADFPSQFIAEFTDIEVTEIGGFFICGVAQPVKTLTDAFKICKE